MQNWAVMGLRIEFLRIGIIKGMYLVLKTTRTYRGPEKCVSDLEMETRAGGRERFISLGFEFHRNSNLTELFPFSV